MLIIVWQIGLRLDVDCYEGPKDDTLIVTKNNYPKFDELISILENIMAETGVQVI